MEDLFKMGPFAGNEVGQIVEILEGAAVSFQLERDPSVEQKKMKSDMASIWRTEFRSDVFIDQSYYVITSLDDKQKCEELLGRFLGRSPDLSPDVTPEETARSRFEERVWKKEVADRKRRDQRWAQWILLPLIAAALTWWIYSNLMR